MALAPVSSPIDAGTVTAANVFLYKVDADAGTVLVKASYVRSFEGAPTGGGRVTELVAFSCNGATVEIELHRLGPGRNASGR